MAAISRINASRIAKRQWDHVYSYTNLFLLEIRGVKQARQAAFAPGGEERDKEQHITE